MFSIIRDDSCITNLHYNLYCIEYAVSILFQYNIISCSGSRLLTSGYLPPSRKLEVTFKWGIINKITRL